MLRKVVLFLTAIRSLLLMSGTCSEECPLPSPVSLLARSLGYCRLFLIFRTVLDKRWSCGADCSSVLTTGM